MEPPAEGAVATETSRAPHLRRDRGCRSGRAGARRRSDRGLGTPDLFPRALDNNKGITVIHPQVDAASPLGGGLGVTAGWEADAVSGATPALFVDTVTKATPFHDFRQQVHGGFTYNRPDAGIGASYAYGWENDYRSHSLSAIARDDLYDHNFTLGLSYSTTGTASAITTTARR